MSHSVLGDVYAFVAAEPVDPRPFYPAVLPTTWREAGDGVYQHAPAKIVVRVTALVDRYGATWVGLRCAKPGVELSLANLRHVRRDFIGEEREALVYMPPQSDKSIPKGTAVLLWRATPQGTP